MDVDECIRVYTELFSRIFAKAGIPFSFSKRQIKGRYESEILEREVKALLQAKGMAEEERLKEGDDVDKSQRCKVYVLPCVPKDTSFELPC